MRNKEIDKDNLSKLGGTYYCSECGKINACEVECNHKEIVFGDFRICEVCGRAVAPKNAECNCTKTNFKALKEKATKLLQRTAAQSCSGGYCEMCPVDLQIECDKRRTTHRIDSKGHSGSEWTQLPLPFEKPLESK